MIVADTKWQPDLNAAGRSKYKALAQYIREGIVSGQFCAGARLPPVRELAFQLGVTPGTVARAYAVLTDEGRLEAGVGRGTFVKAARVAASALPDTSAPDPLVDFYAKRPFAKPQDAGARAGCVDP